MLMNDEIEHLYYLLVFWIPALLMAEMSFYESNKKRLSGSECERHNIKMNALHKCNKLDIIYACWKVFLNLSL